MRRERLGPRPEYVRGEIGVDFRNLVEAIASDYASTHIDTFRPIPREGRAIISQWLEDQDAEDYRRESIELDGISMPPLLVYARHCAHNLDLFRHRDEAAIAPDVIKAIDLFSRAVARNLGVYAIVERGELKNVDENESTRRIVLRQVVEAARDFADVFVRHGREWMTIDDRAISHANGSRELARTRRDQEREQQR